MSGLLSNLGGIDSSLFQKPQSMKDMRTTQPMPAQQTSGIGQNMSFQTASNKPSTSTYQSPGASQGQSAAGRPSAGIPSSQSQLRDSGTKLGPKTGNANSQLDALLGDGLFAKKNR